MEISNELDVVCINSVEKKPVIESNLLRGIG